MPLLVALVFLPVAGANAVADRLGVQPFGFSSTIVLLTAVHFTFAGFALLVIGALTYARIPRHWLEVALAGVVIGVPITAVGFFEVPVASWIGALLVAAGGLGIGAGLVRAAGLGRTSWSRRLTLWPASACSSRCRSPSSLRPDRGLARPGSTSRRWPPCTGR